MNTKKILRYVAASIVLGFSNYVIADVHIIYPFDGASHPKIFPGPSKIDSYYLPISIAVTCEGGPHRVNWKIDDEELGSASFYDQITVQQIFKVGVGGHVFRVETDDQRLCGSKVIKLLVEE